MTFYNRFAALILLNSVLPTMLLIQGVSPQDNLSPSNITRSGISNNGTSNPKGHTYGAECAKSEDCDLTIGLSCNKGECDCARPDEMIYEQATNSCIVLESFSCDSIPGMATSEFVCTTHADCIAAQPTTPRSTIGGKKCVCAKGFSVTDQRQCKGDLNTHCDDEDEVCNDFAMLTCHIGPGESMGTCGCYDPRENVFEQGKCMALAGGICTHNTPPYVLACTANATCEVEHNAHSQNTTGVCRCNKGMTQQNDRKCGPSKSAAAPILQHGGGFLSILLSIIGAASLMTF